jgi:hypothetical protein
MDVPETRYAQSGGLSIAYQVFGEGPRDIVFVPGFISHCDLSWATPLLRGIAARLGSFARVITFDKRGTGLSDRTLGFGTAENRMDDIRAVMDTAGFERAAIIGISRVARWRFCSRPRTPSGPRRSSCGTRGQGSLPRPTTRSVQIRRSPTR